MQTGKLLMSIVFLSLAGAFAFVILRELARAMRTYSWASTLGQIVESKVIRTVSRRGQRMYRFRVAVSRKRPCLPNAARVVD